MKKRKAKIQDPWKPLPKKYSVRSVWGEGTYRPPFKERKIKKMKVPPKEIHIVHGTSVSSFDITMIYKRKLNKREVADLVGYLEWKFPEHKIKLPK